MRFHSPENLWLMLPLLGLIFLWIFIEKWRLNSFSQFASKPLLGTLIRGDSFERLSSRRKTKFILSIVAILFAIVALARPQIGSHEETVPSQGLDIVFVLDVSNSMLAEDVVPSRLKKAKHIIRGFVDKLSGDRVGVVAFAGSAYPAVPLTTDYEFVRQTLEVLDESAISNQGSHLGRAVSVGIELLDRGATSEQAEAGDSASRILIVLSDGEDHEGDESSFKKVLKEKGIRVYSIGVGTPKGSPIPLKDPGGMTRGYKKDSSGNMILTKLETANLEVIATKTGGKFYLASANEGEIDEILGFLSSMDRTSGAGRSVVVYDEVFQYPLAISVFLFLLMLLLRDARKKSKFVSLCFLFLIFLQSPYSSFAATSIGEYNHTKKGLGAYQGKDFPEAIQEFGKAQASDPESAKHHLNLGDALLKAGSPEGAVSEFQEVTKSKDPNEAAKGFYNLGKAFELLQNHEMALRSYQDGLNRLAQDPKADPEIEQRLKRALEVAQEKKKQQQQQKPNQDGKGDSKNSDKSNKSDDQNKDKDKDQKEKEDKKYQIPKKKPEFKPEKIGESEAKKIMQQLQESEQKTQQRLMRSKTGKAKNEKNDKDW